MPLLAKACDIIAHMNVDLHAHSYYSDGELAPSDVIKIAVENGLDAVALTDHDSTDGLIEAKQAADSYGIQLIPGTEISASWRYKDIHIVGVGIDPAQADLAEGLQHHQQLRRDRAKAIGDCFEQIGIQGAFEAASQLAGKGLIARPHFARFLVDAGHCKDMGTAFRKYLRRGKPAYVKTAWRPLEEVIGWIKNAGGIAILAHPCRYQLTSTQLRHLLQDFVEAGGEGIEVVTGNQTLNDTQHVARLCKDYKLLASRGSDFHGPSSRAELGKMAQLPLSCTPVWSRLV